MAQYTYDKLIKYNVAPANAKCIGVYDSGGTRVGEIPLGLLANEHSGTPLYKIGLVSDVHTDDSDYQYNQTASYNYNGDEATGDLRRTLTWFRDVEHVNLVCCCGDLSQQGQDADFAFASGVIADVLTGTPFYTCCGNHDVYTGKSGAPNFKNYFNTRTIDTSSYSLVTSTAYTNSFYFLKDYTVNGVSKTDVFIFLSQYGYTSSTSGGQYLSDDMNWVEGIISAHTSDRIFVFNHLFLIEYAGNLGRINGSGGIYPSSSIIGGTTSTRMNALAAAYPNVYWFSGHSHWKWDLQKYQSNTHVARVGSNGAWTINVPSNALPIDSDYSSTNGESGNNRVRKPLESQATVIDVYPDTIIIRGMDMNINASQNGDTTQGYSGSTYTRYLPIAEYDLPLG